MQLVIYKTTLILLNLIKLNHKSIIIWLYLSTLNSIKLNFKSIVIYLYFSIMIRIWCACLNSFVLLQSFILEKEFLFWLSSLVQNRDIKKLLWYNYFFFQVILCTRKSAFLYNLGNALFYPNQSNLFSILSQPVKFWKLDKLLHHYIGCCFCRSSH